jgi:microcystin-dependent protein
MKKLDTSAITASVAFPVKSGTLIHIQNAYTEAISQAIIGQIGAVYDSSKCYILSGLVNSGTLPEYNITAGSVFFNGETFLVDAASGTLTGSNVVTGIVSTTYFAAANADSVVFTDGQARNVHQIRKISLQPGLAGSGVADFNNFRIVNPSANLGKGEMKMYVGTISDFGADGLGIAPNVRGWAICDGRNGTYDMSGRGPMGYDPANAKFNAVGTKTGGEETHTLTIPELPTFTPQVDPAHPSTTIVTRDTTSSGTLGLNNVTGGFEATVATLAPIGANQPHNNLHPYRTVLFIQRIY